jgi:hypothetical protein
MEALDAMFFQTVTRCIDVHRSAGTRLEEIIAWLDFFAFCKSANEIVQSRVEINRPFCCRSF